MTAKNDASNILNNGPICWLQWQVFLICSLVAMCDGFNAQVLAIVAPALAAQWSLSTSTMTALFVSGLCGTAIGSSALGWVADRIGRKPVLLAALAVMCVFTLLSVFAVTPYQLGGYRFLAGLGLGAALPQILILTVEYSPERRRNFIMNAMMCGFPVGAAAGGALVAQLLPRYGWQAAFIIGGIVPLLLLPTTIFGLPESLRFLATKKDAKSKLDAILQRLGVPKGIEIASPARVQTRAPLRDILDVRFRFGTIAIWIMSCGANIVHYFLMAWSPWLLKAAGMTTSGAIYGTVALGVGTALGALAIGFVMDRFAGYLTVCGGYVLSVLTILGISFAIGVSIPMVLVAIFAAGVLVGGSRGGVAALSTGFFPTRIRATGVSTSYSFSQVGSIVGPMVGGILISLPMSHSGVFRSAAVVAAVNAVVGWMLYRHTLSARAVEPQHELPLGAANDASAGS